MKSLLALCLLTLTLSGCTVDGYEVNAMNRICTGRDGVDEYDTFNKVVRCNNGQWMSISAGIDRR